MIQTDTETRFITTAELVSSQINMQIQSKQFHGPFESWKGETFGVPGSFVRWRVAVVEGLPAGAGGSRSQLRHVPAGIPHKPRQ